MFLDQQMASTRSNGGSITAVARSRPASISCFKGIRGNTVRPSPASKEVRKMLIELMSATTRGAASPACEAALSMMGRTPWGLAGKINERGSTCFREMVSAVTHGVLRGFDQVHAFG